MGRAAFGPDVFERMARTSPNRACLSISVGGRSLVGKRFGYSVEADVSTLRFSHFQEEGPRRVAAHLERVVLFQHGIAVQQIQRDVRGGHCGHAPVRKIPAMDIAVFEQRQIVVFGVLEQPDIEVVDFSRGPSIHWRNESRGVATSN